MSDKIENTLPNSPHEMPTDLYNDANWLRRAMSSLRDFDWAGIDYEVDHAASAAMGEKVGEWTVDIGVSRKQIVGKHSCLFNALWYATTLAENASNEQYLAREKARADALAKLSEAERKVLGL